MNTKLSQAQKNYVTAQAIYNAAFASDSLDMNDFENALELVDLRERELLVWGRENAVKFCKVFGKSKADAAAIDGMFESLIAGEYVHAGQKDKIIKLCLKLAA
jgi:hypothetical protein